MVLMHSTKLIIVYCMLEYKKAFFAPTNTQLYDFLHMKKLAIVLMLWVDIKF